MNRKQGIEPWLNLLNNILRVDRLVLQGETGYSLLDEFIHPNTLFPTIHALAVRDVDALHGAVALRQWVKARKRNGYSIPAHIDLAGDPLKELHSQLRDLSGAGDFTLRWGDRLIEGTSAE